MHKTASGLAMVCGLLAARQGIAQQDSSRAPTGNAPISAGAAVRGGCPVIVQDPQSAEACPGSGATFAVVAEGATPLSYRWEIQIAPDVWAGMGNDPLPLPCGGFAYASQFFSDTTPIGVHPCPGVSFYMIRAVVTNACGMATSAPAALSFCTGDLNCDGVVSASDLAELLGSWGATGSHADLNGDGVVNAADLAIMLGSWGLCPQPTPS